MGDPGQVEELEPYSVLGVSRTDSPRALRRRYQELVRQLHPDRAAQGLGKGEREEQLRRFLEVERAWRTLGDAETRRAHDLRARDRDLQQEGPIQDSFSIDDMDWDDGTDSPFPCPRVSMSYHVLACPSVSQRVSVSYRVPAYLSVSQCLTMSYHVPAYLSVSQYLTVSHRVPACPSFSQRVSACLHIRPGLPTSPLGLPACPHVSPCEQTSWRRRGRAGAAASLP
ncbi:dnaJ homolog subfamily C member 24-like isoform X3 [Lampetra planeri]